MAEIINTSLDTTELPPKTYTAQDPESAKIAGYVRTKTYGRHVREAIARGIELNSTRSKNAEELAKETVITANDTKERLNQQIGALTTDSEVIDAREGEPLLRDRLKTLEAKSTKLYHNSDSSVTNLIKIGMSYLDEGLIYGNDQTLYTEVANGQIDCSSFVAACLEGVTFANSKYNNPENIRVNPSLKLAENAVHERSGRVLANSIAEYFNRFGYLQETNYDFTQLEAGDILFLHQSQATDYFRNISHIAIVLDRREGYVKFIESAGPVGSVGVRVHEFSYQRLIDFKAQTWARIPLYDPSLEISNIVAEPKVVRTASSSNFGQVHIVEALQERTPYTLVIDSQLNDNLNNYLLLRTWNNEIIYDNHLETNRTNGLIKRVFHIPKGGLKSVYNWFNLLIANTNGTSLGGTSNYLSIYKGVKSTTDHLDLLGSTFNYVKDNVNYTKMPDGTLMTYCVAKFIGSASNNMMNSTITFPVPYVDGNYSVSVTPNLPANSGTGVYDRLSIYSAYKNKDNVVLRMKGDGTNVTFIDTNNFMADVLVIGKWK